MTALKTTPDIDFNELTSYFLDVRSRTEKLALSFSSEDWMVQSMEDASPIKWNIAHTSWFFETFLLSPHNKNYKLFNDQFGFLFNSYYNAIGDRLPRSERGLISRPSSSEVVDYREYVTDQVCSLVKNMRPDLAGLVKKLILIGCAHEEQHQELLLTDINHGLSRLPTPPCIFNNTTKGGSLDAGLPHSWIEFDGGVSSIGFDTNEDAPVFSFDNEGPKHRVFLSPFALASRAVTNEEFLLFINEGGYRDPAFWLSDGWDLVTKNSWSAPLYWRNIDSEWYTHSLFGEHALEMSAPVCHLSFYEAAAYAEWSGFRLPTEFEWEHAVDGVKADDNLLDGTSPQPPLGSSSASGLAQMYGDVWEWTASPYVAYPGYRTPPGAIGEYNGKFMSSQMVLRGGSCMTPRGHIRPTYRNFFPPRARWQYSGFRLARDM